MARRGEPPADDIPAVLVAEGPHGPVVHALNRPAALTGVTQGGRLADMRALCPTLRVEQADPAGDAAGLGRLMLWVRRWGPWSAVDGLDGLVLDITGAAHLFGGEAALLAEMQGRFAVAGLTARLAVAPGWGAAWGLARFGAERAICAAGDMAMLHALPVAALRLGPETQLLLRRLGLKRVGDIAAIPRLSLTRRFARAAPGDNPLLRLDQLTGRAAEPLDASDAPQLFEVAARLPEPVQDPTDWLPGLMRDLCALLAGADRGCRRLRLSVFRVDGERRDILARTAAPTRAADHLLRLLRGRLEGLDPGYGFDLITLTAQAVEALAPARPRLDGSRDEALALAQLVDRLTARFGAPAVHRPMPRESHIPERAEAPGPAFAPDRGRAVPQAARIRRAATSAPDAAPSARNAVLATIPADDRPRHDPSDPTPTSPTASPTPGEAEALRAPAPRREAPNRERPAPPALRGTPGATAAACLHAVTTTPPDAPTCEAPQPAGATVPPLPDAPSCKPARTLARQAEAPSPDPALGAKRPLHLALVAAPTRERDDRILRTMPRDPARPAGRALRPLRLLTPPEEIRVLYAIPEGPPAQFVWRRQTLRVARHTGPERIAPEWWRDRPGTRLRDYFRVEDETGRRLWIYREGLVQDGRGGPPRWFLHGLFA